MMHPTTKDPSLPESPTQQRCSQSHPYNLPRIISSPSKTRFKVHPTYLKNNNNNNK